MTQENEIPQADEANQQQQPAAEPEQNSVRCPNCQGPVIPEGKKIICQACDATFKIVEERGGRIEQVGPFADHEIRISALEGKPGSGITDPPADQATDSETEPEPEPETDEGENPVLGPE